MIAPILAAALGLLALWALHKLQKKLGIEATAVQDELIWKTVNGGVAYAEEWARKQTNVAPTPASGAEKLQQALEFVRLQLGKTGYDKVGQEKITQLLEAALNEKRPTSVTPQPALPPTPAPTP